MKKLHKNLIKIGVPVSVLATGAAITIPLVLSCSKKTENSFFYKDRMFSSKSELINFIKDKSQEKIIKSGEETYFVNQGNNQLQFETYQKAFEYVLSNLKSFDAYLKPGENIESLKLSSFTSDVFVKKEEAIRYVIFPKFNPNVRSGELDANSTHTFTYAKLPSISDNGELLNNENEAVERARKEAAKSYIQVHNAYFFNGIYFNSKNDVKAYILQNKDTVVNIPKSKMLALNINGRAPIYFDQEKLEDTNGQYYKGIENQIASLATPFYYDDENDKFPIQVTQSKAGELSMKIDDLNYVKINSNENKVTQVVDASMPHGNFYGNYFVQSSRGVKNVGDIEQWHPADSIPQNAQNLTDDLILRSAISYVFTSNGFSSPLDLFNFISISQEGDSLVEFLQNHVENGALYVKELNDDLIKPLLKGARYNHLDVMIASYYFLINKMIKNHASVDEIKTVAHYFQSIAETLDTLLFKLVSPLFASSTNGEMKNNGTNFKFLASAFKFYDSNANDGGVTLSTDPNAYYRRLTGDDESEKNNRVIFQAIKAMIGVESIEMQYLRKNHIVYREWEESFKQTVIENGNNLNNYKKELPELSQGDTPHRNRIGTLRFEGKGVKSDSREYQAIWRNLTNIKSDDCQDALGIDKSQVLANLNAYLLNNQNPIFKKYEENLMNKSKSTIYLYTDHDKVVDGEIRHTKAEREKVNESDFNTNTFKYIDISLSELSNLQSGNQMVDTYSNYKNLKDEVSNAVISLRDRIKSFAVVATTVALQAGIAAATAGAGAEAMTIEEDVQTLNINAQFFSKEAASIVSNQETKLAAPSFRWASSQKASITLINKTTKVLKPEEKSLLEKVADALDVVGKVADAGEKAAEEERKQIENERENLIKNLSNDYLTKTTDMSFLDASEGGYNFGNFVEDCYSVMWSAIKNVVPGLNSIIGFINSFNRTENQIYYFKQTEDGTDFYWDGGEVDYSWWGLSATQKYSLNDLKVFVSPELISGYEKDTFYYNGKNHDDLTTLRLETAQEFIDALLTNKSNANQKLLSHIEYSITLQGEVKPIKGNSREDLARKVIEHIKAYEVGEELFYLGNTGLTAINEMDALTAFVSKIVDNLKPILIIKLPRTNTQNSDDFNLNVDEFKLPYPYYERSTKFEAIPSESYDETKYLIFNSNLNGDANKTLDDKLKSMANTWTTNLEKIGIQDASSKTTSLLNYLNSGISNYGTEDLVNKLIEPILNNFYLPSKEILLEQLISTAPRESHGNSIVDNQQLYSDFKPKDWSTDTYHMYSYVSQNGKINYFADRKVAIENMLENNVYSIKPMIQNQTEIEYEFENKIFSSIDDIYNHIIDEMKNKKIKEGQNE